MTPATAQCMSGPFASVIGAAEVPAGPVETQIRLNENLFHFHHPSIHGGFDRSIFVDMLQPLEDDFNAHHFPRLSFPFLYRLPYSKHLLAAFRRQPCSVNRTLVLAPPDPTFIPPPPPCVLSYYPPQPPPLNLFSSLLFFFSFPPPPPLPSLPVPCLLSLTP